MAIFETKLVKRTFLDDRTEIKCEIINCVQKSGHTVFIDLQYYFYLPLLFLLNNQIVILGIYFTFAKRNKCDRFMDSIKTIQ